MRPAVGSWDLAQAARSPRCAATRATRATRATTEPAATEPYADPAAAAAATTEAAAPSAATTGNDAINVFAQSVERSAPSQNRCPRSNCRNCIVQAEHLLHTAPRSTAWRSKLRRGRGDRKEPTMMELVRPKSGLRDVRALRYGLDPRRHLPHGVGQALRRRGAGAPRDSRWLLDRSHPGHKPPIPQFRDATGYVTYAEIAPESEGLSGRSAVIY